MGDDDGAGEGEGARGVDGGEAGVAARGAEDVWVGDVWGEGGEAREEVVADAAGGC